MLFLFDFHKFEHKYAKVVLRKINVRVSQPKCVNKTLQKQVTKDGQDKRCQAAAKDGHDDDPDNEPDDEPDDADADDDELLLLLSPVGFVNSLLLLLF